MNNEVLQRFAIGLAYLPLVGWIIWRIAIPRIILRDIRVGAVKDITPSFFLWESLPYAVVAIFVHPFKNPTPFLIIIFASAVFLSAWSLYHGLVLLKLKCNNQYANLARKACQPGSEGDE